MEKRQRKEIKKLVNHLEDMLEFTLFDLELDEEEHTPQEFKSCIVEIRKLLKDFNDELLQVYETFKD